MQWGALLLLVASLAAGTLAAMARQGRLPDGWTMWLRQRPGWVPAAVRPGLRVLDRVPLGRDAALLRVELEDGSRLTLAVGTAATVLDRQPAGGPPSTP
jgi:hypothetical protein